MVYVSHACSTISGAVVYIQQSVTLYTILLLKNSYLWIPCYIIICVIMNRFLPRLYLAVRGAPKMSIEHPPLNANYYPFVKDVCAHIENSVFWYCISCNAFLFVINTSTALLLSWRQLPFWSFILTYVGKRGHLRRSPRVPEREWRAVLVLLSLRDVVVHWCRNFLHFQLLGHGPRSGFQGIKSLTS